MYVFGCMWFSQNGHCKIQWSIIFRTTIAISGSFAFLYRYEMIAKLASVDVASRITGRQESPSGLKAGKLGAAWWG